jgi:hypothetical protein
MEALRGALGRDAEDLDAWRSLAARVHRSGLLLLPPGGCGALRRSLATAPGERPLLDWWLGLLGLELSGDSGPLNLIDGLPREVLRLSDGAAMHLIPAGAGTLPGPCYLDQFPVTVARYGSFLAQTQTRLPHQWRELKRYRDRPMIWVSFPEVRAYADWARASLPSGARWREAAWPRSGKGVPAPRYPWGEDPPGPERAVRAEEWGKSGTWHESLPVVGERPLGQGRFGHQELLGCVWEWCRDREGLGDEEEEGDEGDQEGGEVRRLALGGSYLSDLRDLEPGVRAWLQEQGRFPDVGFRLALEVS